MSNINFNGPIGGVQVGNNNQQTIHAAGEKAPSISEIVEAIKAAIPVDSPVKDELFESIDSFIAPETPSDATAESSEEFRDTTMRTLVDKISPYAPAISNALATFGEASLAAIGATNPWLAGLLAVCRKLAGT